MEIQTNANQKRGAFLRLRSKLASQPSKARVVRKLDRAVEAVRPHKTRLVSRFRGALNRQKRLAYIVLLGVTTGAFLYDSDESVLQSILLTTQTTVLETQEFYFGAS